MLIVGIKIFMGDLIKVSLTTVSASVFFTVPAFAADKTDYNKTKWGFVAGAGTIVTPNYSGDNNYRVIAVPFLRACYG